MTAIVHNARSVVKSKCTGLPVHFAHMKFDDRPEPAKRLEKARLSKGFQTPREAAKRFGWKYDSYIQHENGTRGITRAADRYARAYGVSPGWLLTGEATSDTVMVPFVSWVSAGQFRRQDGVLPSEIEKHIPVANLGRGEWIALEVTGDSMDRVAPDGSIIVVDCSDDTLVSDRFYVFVLDNHEATFKQWRREPRPMLRPFSTNLDHLAVPADADDVYVVGRVRKVLTDL